MFKYVLFSVLVPVYVSPITLFTKRLGVASRAALQVGVGWCRGLYGRPRFDGRGQPYPRATERWDHPSGGASRGGTPAQ